MAADCPGALAGMARSFLPAVAQPTDERQSPLDDSDVPVPFEAEDDSDRNTERDNQFGPLVCPLGEDKPYRTSVQRDWGRRRVPGSRQALYTLQQLLI
jgi:hypothetical protein